MPHQQDFAVLFLQYVDRFDEPQIELLAEGGGGWRELGVAKLGRQVER